MIMVTPMPADAKVAEKKEERMKQSIISKLSYIYVWFIYFVNFTVLIFVWHKLLIISWILQ